jgi:asparagine synthase (glutamine-hydrolysing)
MTGANVFQLNEQAIYDYLTYGWRDLDYQTFWKGIQTFPAASWIEINVDKRPDFYKIGQQAHSNWQIPQKRLDSRHISFHEAQDQFKELFTDAVRIRARADAKVAFSLSGGLDSSSILATAAGRLNIPKPIRTYSISFRERYKMKNLGETCGSAILGSD